MFVMHTETRNSHSDFSANRIIAETDSIELSIGGSWRQAGRGTSL